MTEIDRRPKLGTGKEIDKKLRGGYKVSEK